MSSEILNSLGMGGMDPGIWVIISMVSIVLAIAMMILVFVQMSRIRKMSDRLQALCKGSDASSLEAEISQIMQDNKYLMDNMKAQDRDLKAIFRRMEQVYQKCALIRYNANPHIGGKMSFAVAMLDEKDNGFMINCIHNTETCYCYGREIKEGKCEINLGEEESKALEMAKATQLR